MTPVSARAVPSGILRLALPAGVLGAMLSLSAPVCRADGGYPPFRVMTGGTQDEASMDGGGMGQRQGQPTRANRFPGLPALADFAHEKQAQPAPPPGEPPGDIPDLTQFTLEQLTTLDVAGVSLETSVPGAHTHLKGQWMFSNEYMLMGGIENLDGTREVPVPVILQKFRTTPISMTMAEDMPMLMYAPSDSLTLMAMVPYIHDHMNHVRRDGTHFLGDTHGTGDPMLAAIYNAYGNPRKYGSRVLIDGGITIPTGSIDEKNPEGKQFEYMMQLGSGTVDLYPGVTYLSTSKKWSWGAQTVETVRLGMNSHHYKFGNDYRATTWVEYNVNESIAPSFTVHGHSNGNIIGRDPLLDPLQEPTRDPNDYAGTRVDVLLGISLYAPKGKLKGARVSLQGGVPVIQSLDGPQPKMDWMTSLNASYTFGGKTRRQQTNPSSPLMLPAPSDSGKGGESEPGKGR